MTPTVFNDRNIEDVTYLYTCSQEPSSVVPPNTKNVSEIKVKRVIYFNCGCTLDVPHFFINYV